jgi:hypothetical protein
MSTLPSHISKQGSALAHIRDLELKNINYYYYFSGSSPS